MEDKAAAEQVHESDVARLAELTEQRDQLQRLLQVMHHIALQLLKWV